MRSPFSQSNTAVRERAGFAISDFRFEIGPGASRSPLTNLKSEITNLKSKRGAAVAVLVPACGLPVAYGGSPIRLSDVTAQTGITFRHTGGGVDLLKNVRVDQLIMATEGATR